MFGQILTCGEAGQYVVSHNRWIYTVVPLQNNVIFFQVETAHLQGFQPDDQSDIPKLRKIPKFPQG
jgi:hypothetical protein